MWPLNLTRDFPRRARRLNAQLRQDAYRFSLFPPEDAEVAGIRARLHGIVAAVFDLLGGPDLAQFLMHVVMRTTALTPDEVSAIASVLGPEAIRYGDVRVAEGGILSFIFRLNGQRAFATWHTIHMPGGGAPGRDDLSLVVHEAIHVMQYERIGSAYLGQAIYAHIRSGRDSYRYGGPAGLEQALKRGLRLKAFNREAQAQIAQDYYRLRTWQGDAAAYEPYLAEIRHGAF
jgi:hypothetical protein